MEIKGLYLVLSQSCCIFYSLGEIVQIALDEGVRLFQLREKTVPYKKFINLANDVKKIISQHNYGKTRAALIINDNIDVAMAVNADGVHLGISDISYEYARTALGPDKIIGLSADDINHIRQFNGLNCNYIGVSGVFNSTTKDIGSHIWGITGLEKAALISRHPLVAIGGINQNNIHSVTPYCQSVAVVSAVCGSKDPRAVIKQLSSQLKLE